MFMDGIVFGKLDESSGTGRTNRPDIRQASTSSARNYYFNFTAEQSWAGLFLGGISVSSDFDGRGRREGPPGDAAPVSPSIITSPSTSRDGRRPGNGGRQARRGMVQTMEQVKSLIAAGDDIPRLLRVDAHG